MKNLFYLLFALPLLFSCGGDSSSEENDEKSENSDVEAFCECVKNPTRDCEDAMEKLEEEFQKDKKRYDAFAKGAREECPDAEKYISRMN
jgi:hypothetical protein